MYRPFFEMFGAFVSWAASGFRGKYEDRLGQEVSYRDAIVGLLTFIGLTVTIILLVQEPVSEIGQVKRHLHSFYP
jgi:hypothetical protein